MKFREKKKIALVLSGGGIKAAAFHIGVCLALREKGFSFAGGSPAEVENNFPIDGNPLTIRSYVGSSAGSVISTFLAAGYSVEAIIEAFERGVRTDLDKLKRGNTEQQQFNRLKAITYRDIFHLNGGSFVNFVPNFMRRKSIVTGGLEALVKNGFKIDGLFTTRGLEKYFRRNVWPQNRFDSLGVELYVIATQLNHSRKVVFGNFETTTKIKTIKYANYSSISEAVAASASLPPVFAPFKIRNQKGKELFFFDFEEEASIQLEQFSEPLKYLYEPNASIMKAGAYKALTKKYNVLKLHPNTHLYTSEILVSDFPGRIFQIDQCTKFDKKEIVRALPGKKANLATRNFPEDIQKIKKRMGLTDGGEIFLFACTIYNGKKLFIITKKLDKK